MSNRPTRRNPTETGPRTSPGNRRHGRRQDAWRVAIATCTAAVLLGSCGVRTMPRAPEDTAARAPDTIKASLGEEGVIVTWSRPTKAVDGSRLYDLAKFEVQRQTDDEPFHTIGTIDVTDLDRIRPQRSFHFTDTAVPAGTVRYRVRAVTADGETGIATEPVSADGAAPATKGAR